MDPDIGHRLLAIKDRIENDFTAGNWEELGLLTGESDRIMGHRRLLRSLSFQDDDYAGNIITILRQIVQNDPRKLPIIEQYLDSKFPADSTYVSAVQSERRITFSPHVFKVPKGYVELDLVAVMMPFDREFDDVHDAIKRAAIENRCRCLRADNFWVESVIVQDIFNLIFHAHVVVVDFTGKNPNVMYETGIAHTLGKHVIPISQNLDDVPFDMRHHRVLKYLPNAEGMRNLFSRLSTKFQQLTSTPSADTSTESFVDDHGIPF